MEMLRDIETIITPVNIKEQPDAMIIEIEVPGIKPDEIDVSVRDELIVIEGIKRDTDRDISDEKRFVCMEREFGFFRKVIEITIPFNKMKAKAILKNGILYIELPKIKEKREKTVKIPIVVEK